MEIKKAVTFPYVKKPIKFVRPIVDELGQSVRNMYISDNCELYDIDEWESHEYFGDCPEADIRVNIDSHGRKYAAINDDSKNHKRTQHLARLCKRAFDEPKHSVDFYKSHQIDHINPSIPVSNHIDNLEWVTPQENMYRAGKTGVMQKKYTKELIGEICERIIEGQRRIDISREMGIDVHLIDDITIGKSHRSVTEQYLDKGFKYRTKRDKEARDALAEEICKLIASTNLRDADIARKLKCDHRMVGGIRSGFIYKHISRKYGIINE